MTFLAIVGPGLIVMVGDNDAGGVATYAQAGQNYGYSLLWVLLLLIPVLIVNQEMVVRLGAVTGVGHARLINERFGKFWGWFSVGDLFLLNFLTIVTEFIGVSLAMSYFGVSPYISVPIAAAMLVAITASGSFRRWERAMFAVHRRQPAARSCRSSSSSTRTSARSRIDFVVPGIQGGVSSNAVLLIIAIVGTTVAPWQLVLPAVERDRQADHAAVYPLRARGHLPRLAGRGRRRGGDPGRDRLRGRGHLAWSATSPTRSASPSAFGAKSGFLGAVFALVLLDASIIGAAAVTLSTSYAFGDVFNIKHSLHRKFRDAKAFYASYTAIVVLAAGDRADARRAARPAHHRGAGAGRRAAAERERVLAAAVQRPRGARPVDERPLAQHRRRADRRPVLLMLSGTLVVTTLFAGASAAAVAWSGSRSGWRSARRSRSAGSGCAAGARRRPAGRPPTAPARVTFRADVARRADELADAAARAAQAGGLVARPPSSASCCCAATWSSRCCC